MFNRMTYIKKEPLLAFIVLMTSFSAIIRLISLIHRPLSFSQLPRPLYKYALVIILLLFFVNLISTYLNIKTLNRSSKMETTHNRTVNLQLTKALILYWCIFLGASTGILSSITRSNWGFTHNKPIAIADDVGLYFSLLAILVISIAFAKIRSWAFAKQSVNY